MLTTANSAEFVAVLEEANPGAPSVKVFAEEYKGRVIEFDGNVAASSPHGKYKTRFDMLIYDGNFDFDSARGPNFRLTSIGPEDIKAKDGYLHLPSLFAAGSNLHVKAEIEYYNETQESFFLSKPTLSDRS